MAGQDNGGGTIAMVLGGLRALLRPRALGALRHRVRLKVGKADFTVLDFRPAGTRDTPAVATMLQGAVERLFTTGDFEDFIASEIKCFVVVPGLPLYESVECGQFRSYGIDLSVPAEFNAHFLACEILAAAAVSHATRAAKRRLSRGEIQAIAWKAQRAYLTGFADAQEWFTYFDRLRRSAA